jgi:lactoylglutathione lyase
MSNDLLKPANVRQAIPFFMVMNMETSLDFYLKGLGFELKLKWEPRGKIEWCSLLIGNASIMLQEYRTKAPVQYRGKGMSVYFICEDALAIYNQIITNGITATEPFVGNNMWVAGLKDPDGYQIYFESPTDVPEETNYSEWMRNNRQ